jgi:predicted permease
MPAIDSVVQDLRYALRTMQRNPGFASVVVLTLALGIGATTAVFSLVDGILLSQLPYLAPEQLVSVTGTYPGGAFAAMRDEMKALDVAAYAEGQTFTLKATGEPARITAARVSAELFTILGVKPVLGRWLLPGEDSVPRDRTIVLSDDLWASVFGRDRAIVGRFVELDGVPREVVAVMPPSFRFPSARTQAWVPLGLDPRDTPRYWAGDFMPVLGRLRPGASMSSARTDVGLFQLRVREKFPWSMPGDWNRNVSVIPLHDAIVSGVRSRLLVLAAAALLVLVIACANVANLNLARALAREREISIRTAIGAGPRRIARQLLTESVALACLAAIVGLLFATQAIAMLKLVLPPDTPRLGDAHLNWRVLGFAGTLGVLTGCAFGCAPVLQTWRHRLTGSMESGGRGGAGAGAAPLRTALAVAQIACAVMLVIAAGLLVRSVWTLMHADRGFQADRVVTARISPGDSLCSTDERCFAFYRTLESDARESSNVSGAALVNTLPLTGAIAKRSLNVEGFTVPTGQTAPLFWLHVITPDYFTVMGIRVERGRVFSREDLSGNPPVAVVTASAARRFWPGEDPIGKHVQFVGENRWRTVVGTVADVRAYDLTRSEPGFIDGTLYVPHGPNATLENGRIPIEMSLVVRTTMDSGQLSTMLRRRAAGGVSGNGAVVSDVRAMSALVADAVAAPAATTSLLVTMGALALALGCIGVYGVLSFLVSRQMRDFGIRLALGAQRGDIFWLVISKGAVLSTAGIAVGIAGAVTVMRWLASQLYGVTATDPATYVSVAVAVAAITLIAAYIPTRRAMRVDPIVVLRNQ